MEDVSVIFYIGSFGVSATVVTTWVIMALLVGACIVLGRHLRVDRPGRVQMVLESVIELIDGAIADMLPGRSRLLLPFVGTLWIFLVFANLTGLIPGLHSPTGDLSLTAALALLVFFSVHWFGVRNAGFWAYLRHYLSPTPIMLPFHVISELSRTVALAVRLFGNIASLEMAALLVLIVAGFLVPVPILVLHVVEALVQAYIFGMLALVYIAGGIQSQQKERPVPRPDPSTDIQKTTEAEK